MSTCEIFGICSFVRNEYNKFPSTVGLIMSTYCVGGGHISCARYKVYRFHGIDKVPADLFPTHNARGDMLSSGESMPP